MVLSRSANPRKAVLNVSDLHYGDRAQYGESLEATMLKAIGIIAEFEPAEVELLLNGDTVAGTGIFRLQEAQNIVALGGWQAWWGGLGDPRLAR